MILVIGGASQGKKTFARERLGVKQCLDGKFGDADCICNLQDMVLLDGFDDALADYLGRHQDAVLICNEVGCGIVPLGAKDREFREKTGRVCCQLAASAKEVYRVFCGIGTRIK